MSEAPERIKYDYYMGAVNPSYSDDEVIEYIRADLYEQLQAENEILRGLVADCIEDAGEFETDWNKKARAALNKKAIAERI